MQDHPIVHLVDDDVSVSDACRFLLEGYGFAVTYWSQGERFLAEADPYVEGCLILDMHMPGMSGSRVHARLRERGSTLGVVVLTGHGDVGMAVEEMKHGAVDFLQKPIAGRELISAVRAALARSHERVERRELASRAAALSAREREIAELVAGGLTNREIADRLHLAVRTIEVHRASLMKKLGAERTADLVRLWQLIEAETPGPSMR
jgi:two-component system, LuxR family, response regulator TtrR